MVIDNDPVAIEAAKGTYDNYVYGDIFDPRTWERANTENATLVVSTIEDRRISETILDLDGEADTILTAASTDEALDLLEAGAFYVNVPDVLAAEQLAEYIEATFSEPEYGVALRAQNIAELQRRVV